MPTTVLKPNRWRHSLKGRHSFAAFKPPPAVIAYCDIADGQRRAVSFVPKAGAPFSFRGTISSGGEVLLPARYRRRLQRSAYVDISVDDSVAPTETRRQVPTVKDPDLEASWHQKMLEIYDQVKALSGYNATRFLQKVRRVGGLTAAKNWLSVASATKEPTAGFLKLTEIGRLDTSLEASALRLPWRRLFTRDELKVAAERLRSYGYHHREIRRPRRPALIPEEISGSPELLEGARTRITVNAYERNARARARCIAHYGRRCVSCKLSFPDRYGQEIREIIHVHHVRPIASIGRSYRLDPVRDLRPLCPNCHAVVHQREPPFTIHEVQTMLNRANKRLPRSTRAHRR